MGEVGFPLGGTMDDILGLPLDKRLWRNDPVLAELLLYLRYDGTERPLGLKEMLAITRGVSADSEAAPYLVRLMRGSAMFERFTQKFPAWAEVEPAGDAEAGERLARLKAAIAERNGVTMVP